MATNEPQVTATAADATKFAPAVVPHFVSGGLAVPQTLGFTPVEITSKTTTLVKSGPGMIASITVNTAGSADTITVYDALTATGTPIATITAPGVGQKFCEGYNFAVGCTIVTGGTTAGKYGVAFA